MKLPFSPVVPGVELRSLKPGEDYLFVRRADLPSNANPVAEKDTDTVMFTYQPESMPSKAPVFVHTYSQETPFDVAGRVRSKVSAKSRRQAKVFNQASGGSSQPREIQRVELPVEVNGSKAVIQTEIDEAGTLLDIKKA